jgi:hypothetical protein
MAASGPLDLPRFDNNVVSLFFLLQDPSVGGHCGSSGAGLGRCPGENYSRPGNRAVDTAADGRRQLGTLPEFRGLFTIRPACPRRYFPQVLHRTRSEAFSRR